MKFEWDDKKNIANFKKRELWFEEARTIWADPRSVEFYDAPSSSDEERFIRIGHSSKLRLLLVVYCERQDGDVIRIISARKATSKERKQYEEGI